MNEALKNAIVALVQTNQCRFARVLYRAKESGEVARHTLLLGTKGKGAWEHDAKLYSRLLRNKNLPELDRQALTELLDSVKESIAKWGTGEANSRYTKADTYQPVKDAKGNALNNIKEHKETGELYVCGFTLPKLKVKVVPGVFRIVNSSPLTRRKNFYRSRSKVGRYREFVVSNLATVKANGGMVEVEDASLIS